MENDRYYKVTVWANPEGTEIHKTEIFKCSSMRAAVKKVFDSMATDGTLKQNHRFIGLRLKRSQFPTTQEQCHETLHLHLP